MQEHYDWLGLSPGASPAEVKAAYHAKLKAFPAHSHPQEFKQTRAAYEALKKAAKSTTGDFFEPRPVKAELDDSLVAQLKAQATKAAEVTLEDLILLTF